VSGEYIPLRGTDAATTPVFLTQAEYDALEDPAGSGLYPSLTGKRVIVTDAISIDSAFAMVPDYPNRIAVADNGEDFLVGSAEGVTKTYTPPGLGYIQLLGKTASGMSVTGIYGAYTINPTHYLVYESDTFPSYTRRQSQPTPVAAGQEITFNMSSNSTGLKVELFFLPPKFVKQLAPVVVEEPDYGLSEVQLPTKWVGGKPIYRIAFKDQVITNLNGLGNSGVINFNLSTLIPDIDRVVDECLMYRIPAVTNYNRIGTPSSDGFDITDIVATTLGSQYLFIKNISGSAFNADMPFTLSNWVEYTKLDH
jgi:hypothetical protein